MRAANVGREFLGNSGKPDEKARPKVPLPHRPIDRGLSTTAPIGLLTQPIGREQQGWGGRAGEGSVVDAQQSYTLHNRQTFSIAEELERRQANPEFALSYQPVQSARDSDRRKPAINRSGYLGSLVNEEL